MYEAQGGPESDYEAPVRPSHPGKSAPDEATDTTALLTLARERFNGVVQAESELRQEQLEDKRFIAGQQWNHKERATRIRDKRPCLTINRLPGFKRQITGNARANRPEIQINPVDDFGDPETAEILSGIVKHIESISHAQVAYDTAVDDQVTMGRGYLRIITEYCDELGFDQDIKIKRVRNALCVYYDPRCQEVDYSDAMFAFIACDYAKEEFKKRWPDVDVTALTDDDTWSSVEQKQQWIINGDLIRVVEYFYVEYEPTEIALLSNGQILPKDEAEKAVEDSYREAQKGVLLAQQGLVDPAQIPPMLEIVRTRQAHKRIVQWAKLCGTTVLKQTTWPGKWIPIVPVLGEEIDLDGRIDLRGMVRDARDQQRLYNFQVSALVEAIGLAPRAPYIIAGGQMEGYEKIWRTANQKSYAYLPYKAISLNGTFAPPPQRQSFEPAIAAIVASIAQHDNDMKATTGFYDASLGERGPEQSGKAILARQKQGEVGSIHYTDNLARALWAVGRQLLDLIPKIYDAPRVIRITGVDEKKRSVMVHAGKDQAPDQSQPLPPGVQKVYDLSVGRYDVVVGTGPSHATRRQEAVEMMTQAIQANPKLLEIIGDLYFGSMDWGKARQIAERLKKVLPPNLQDDEDGENPDVLKAKLGQLEQQLQERTEMLQQASEDIRTDKIKALHQKEIALLNAKVELIKLRLTIQAGEQKQQTQAELDRERLAHDREKHGSKLAFDREQQERELGDRADARMSEFGARKADTMLDAELNNLDTERQIAVDARVREEQRDDQREQRAFEAQQAQQSPAGPGGPQAGA